MQGNERDFTWQRHLSSKELNIVLEYMDIPPPCLPPPLPYELHLKKVTAIPRLQESDRMRPLC